MHGVIWNRYHHDNNSSITGTRTHDSWPTSNPLSCVRIYCTQKHGNEMLARDCWSQAMALDPLNAYVCHALSNLERRLRNFERAREVLEAVVQTRPTSALCVSLSELERQLGNADRAKEVLVHGLNNCDKERSKLLLALAWLEEDAFDNPLEAKKLLNDALRLDKNNVRIHVAKAGMELRANKVLEARETLRRATALSSEDGQHYTMWATLEIDAGDVREARRLLEEGAAKFPGDQFLLQRWGALESKHGSVMKARELFDRSIIIQPHAPTFVAWAILEEDQGIEVLHPKTHFQTHQAVSPDEIGDDREGGQTEDIGLPEFDGADESNGEFVDSALAGLDLDSNVGIEEVVAFTLDGADDSGPPSSSTRKRHHRRQLSTLERDPPLDFSSPDSNRQQQQQQLSAGEAISFGPLGDIPVAPPPPTPAAETFAAAQFRKARHLFSIGMVVDPQHGPLYHAYGNMELRRGNVTGARDVLMRGISMNCTDVTSLYHAWGLLEIKDGRCEEAADIFRRGIELGLKGNREVENGVGFLLHSLGMLEMDGHRIEEAQRVFSTGVSLFPRHAQMLLGLALASAKLGQQEAARQHFRASVDADPCHAHAWQSWAIAEKGVGNIELARILFRQGLRKCPVHAPLWQAFGVMEMQQSNFEVARTLFSQSLQRNPDHAQSYQAWACLEVRLTNLPKAKALVLQGIRRAPSHPALWTVAGLVEDRMGNAIKARKILEAALVRFPNHGALFKVLGELEAKQGQYTKAREIFARGLERDPHCPAVYHAAALLEAKLGNLEGLAALHKSAKQHFRTNVVDAAAASADAESTDIIERIRQLEAAAHEHARGDTSKSTSFIDYPSMSFGSNDTFLFDLGQ